MLLHSEAKSICGSIITWCKSQPCTLKKKIKVQWSFPKTGYFTATICESLKQQYFLAYSCQWLRNGGQKVPAHPSVEPQWSCNLQLCTCCTAGQNVTMQRRCHQKYIHVLICRDAGHTAARVMHLFDNITPLMLSVPQSGSCSGSPKLPLDFPSISHTLFSSFYTPLLPPCRRKNKYYHERILDFWKC